MIEICPPNKCTACHACFNICPKNCISMSKDSLGALYPDIDQNNCINCGLCQKVCPNNNNLKFRTPLACYAAWRKDESKRKFSASGGIAAVMTEYVINNNGVVFGTRYSKDLTAVTKMASTLEEAESFKGSKYVISNVLDAYSKIKKELDCGKNVLYIATPCQISGLISFLRKDYDNLTTIDLICHGVCPSSYLKDEVSYLSNIYNLKNITNITFRGNGMYDEKYLNFHLSIWDNGKITYNQPGGWQYYFAGFLKGITLRENCYSCQYARPERISDITIGDFILLGKDIPFDGPKENTSAIIVNTQKGSAFISSISTKLNIIERNYAEAIKYGPSLRAPFPRHPLSSKFRGLYTQKGFSKAIRKALREAVWKDKLHRLFIRAPKKIWRIITH